MTKIPFSRLLREGAKLLSPWIGYPGFDHDAKTQFTQFSCNAVVHAYLIECGHPIWTGDRNEWNFSKVSPIRARIGPLFWRLGLNADAVSDDWHHHNEKTYCERRMWLETAAMVVDDLIAEGDESWLLDPIA